MLTVGQKIKAIREMKNLTQNFLAEKLGMSAANYSNIENNRTDVSLSRLGKIADILEVDCCQILDFNPSQIFNNSSSYSSTIVHQTDMVLQGLLEQLQIKDEQIQKLNLIIEKIMKQ